MNCLLVGALVDNSLHLSEFFFLFLQQAELSQRPLPVVFGMLDLVVGIAVEVVGKEPYRLHIRKHFRSECQIFQFNGSKEGGCLQVAPGVGFENIHVHIDIIEIGIVFGARIGGRAHKIAKIGKNDSFHHGIEIDHATRLIFIVEEHVIDFSVVVVDASRHFTFAVQLLGKAHLVGPSQQFVHHPLCFFKPARFVFPDGILKLLYAEGHVVKIGYRFDHILFGNIHQLHLEIPERHSGLVGEFGSDLVVAMRIFYIDLHPPVISILVVVIEFAIVGRYQLHHPLCHILDSFADKLGPDMVGYDFDVPLESFHIFKNIVIDALQKVGFVGFAGPPERVRIVDMTDF